MEGRARKAGTIPNNSTKIEVDLSPSTKKMASPPGLGTAGALTLSVVSSVSIVICNKALMSTFKFNFGTTLTSWHLVVTFLSLHAARKIGFFEHKPFDPMLVMGFGVLNGASIGLLNLCLGFNSVGFYQMTKLAIIPCTVVLQTLFLKMRFSLAVQLSLAVLLLGVGIATVTDLQLNFVGSVLAVLAIVTTCVAQIMTNTIQKSHKVSSTQLLYQSAPYQAAILLLTGPFLDRFLTGQNVFAFPYDEKVTGFILLSCLIAVAVNSSTFLVIGRTSPVTYQVLGHLKTCLVLGLGYVLLANPFSWRNILGIVVAMGGMFLYSGVQIQEGRAREKALQSVVKAPPSPVAGLDELGRKTEAADAQEGDPLLRAEEGEANKPLSL